MRSSDARILVLAPPFAGMHQSLGRRVSALLRRRGWPVEFSTIRPDDGPLRPRPGIQGIVVPVYDARIVRILEGIAVPIVNTDGCLDPSP
jgi:hypothetical protein